MADENSYILKISNGLIAYKQFLNDFKTIKEDFQINLDKNNPNSLSNFSFTFREYNGECFIIDKKYLDEFRSAVNFNTFFELLDTLTEENKKKFNEEIKKYLKDNPYIPKEKNIKIYSDLEEMKEVTKNFKNYAIVNEELLCDGMGIPKSSLEGKNFIFSKNKNNTCLISFSKKFSLIIKSNKNQKNINDENNLKNQEENNTLKDGKNIIEENNQNKSEENNAPKNQEIIKEENNHNNPKENTIPDEIEEYKNLYYVEDLTKRIFILLYLNEKRIRNKIKNEIKDAYNFKKYYLINNNWLKEYKEFFMYDLVIKKFKEEFNKGYNDKNNKGISNTENNNNDDDEIYSYKKITFYLNDIVEDIGQIRLYNETTIDNSIRNAKELIPERKMESIKRRIKDKEEKLQETVGNDLDDNYKINAPCDFCLINKDIFDLLEKEEFFIKLDKEVKNKIEYKVLLGNDNIIIKNKLDEGCDCFNGCEYLFYIFKNDEIKYLNDQNLEQNNDPFILYYILKYYENKPFFNDLNIINKRNGLKEFINNKDIDINNIKYVENIMDNNGNYLGYFINIRIDLEYIYNESIDIEKEDNINKEESIEIEKEDNINKEKENDDKPKKASNENIGKNKNLNNNKENKDKNKKNINYVISNEVNLDYINDYDKNKDYHNYFYDVINNNNIDDNYNNENEINKSHSQKCLININNENVNKYHTRNETDIANYKKIIIEKIDYFKNEDNEQEKIKYLYKFLKHNKKCFDFPQLFGDITKNNYRLNIDINILNSEEIRRNIHNNNINDIILINKENLNKIKSFISYDIINKYFILNKEQRKKYLEEHINEFHNFFLFYNKKINIPENISIIENYKDCTNYINNKNEFYIIYKRNKIITKLIRHKKIEKLYYFNYQNESYIYFYESNKKFQLKKLENNYWELIDYDETKN